MLLRVAPRTRSPCRLRSVGAYRRLRDLGFRKGAPCPRAGCPFGRPGTSGFRADHAWVGGPSRNAPHAVTDVGEARIGTNSRSPDPEPSPSGQAPRKAPPDGLGLPRHLRGFARRADLASAVVIQQRLVAVRREDAFPKPPSTHVRLPSCGASAPFPFEKPFGATGFRRSPADCVVEECLLSGEGAPLLLGEGLVFRCQIGIGATASSAREAPFSVPSSH